MPRTLDPTELAIFLKLAETGNFSETALLLGTTQPALSRKIVQIERRLGARLFDRHPRRVALTPVGLELKPLAERLLAEFELGFRDLESFITGRRGRVTVSVLPSTVGALVIPAIADCKASAPEIDVVVRDVPASAIARDVLSGQADIGVTVRSAASPDLTFAPLAFDDVVLACRIDHPLAHAQSLQWHVFARHPFIAFSRGTSIRPLIDSAFHKHELDVTPMHECEQLLTMGSLIASGLGITALPRMALSSMGRTDIVAVPLEGRPVQRELMLMTRIGRSLSPAARVFLDELRARAKQFAAVEA